jgi:peptide deformylase
MVQHKHDPRAEAPTPTQSGTRLRVPVRSVVTCPDPRLAIPCLDVDPFAPEVVDLAEALVATMRESPACIGLAAPQIGAGARIFCMDVTGHKKARTCAGLVVMANPIVVERAGNVVMREGCMSVPHLTGDVARAAEVIVEGLEVGTGRTLRVVADAMEARCLLHEIDHLDGLVFVERVIDASADLYSRKWYA